MKKSGGFMIGIYFLAAVGVLALIGAVFVTARGEQNGSSETIATLRRLEVSLQFIKTGMEDLEQRTSDLSVKNIEPMKLKIEAVAQAHHSYLQALDKKVSGISGQVDLLERRKIPELREQTINLKIQQPLTVELVRPVKIENKVENRPRVDLLRRSGLIKDIPKDGE